MKIRIEVEVGPTELREFLGLPDVSDVQQEAIKALSRKLRSGAAGGADAVAVLRGLVPGTLGSLGSIGSLTDWQRLIGRALQTGRPVSVETTVTPKQPAAKKPRPRGAAAGKKKARTGVKGTSRR